VRADWVLFLLLTTVACSASDQARPNATSVSAPFESRVPTSETPPTGSELVLESPAFANGDAIPSEFTADGANASPPLSWNRAPQGTRSFAVLCIDPDAPRGEFTHWVLWNIAAGARKVDSSLRQEHFLGVAGTNDFGRVGWGGPQPPLGHGPHRYVFRLFALDVRELPLAEGATRSDLEGAMAGHIVAIAETVGVYERGQPELSR